MYYYDYDQAFNVWSPELAVSLTFVAWSLYCVWRLWAGLKLDPHERNLRTLRWEQGASLTPPARRIQAPRTGLIQISLLPLMLCSSGLAMLLAQAQRPDELSRPVTWLLFVLIASWYGAFAWPHLRGVGPLRNKTMAAVLAATVTSFALWVFYMAVDAWHADASYARLKASYATLIWWTTLGGAFGSLVGSMRAAQTYRQLGVTRRDAMSVLGHRSQELSGEPMPVIEATPRSRRFSWGALTFACLASLAFHLAAAPQVFQVVKARVWYDWRYDNWRSTNQHSPLVLTMQTQTANRFDGRQQVFQAATFSNDGHWARNPESPTEQSKSIRTVESAGDAGQPPINHNRRVLLVGSAVKAGAPIQQLIVMDVDEPLYDGVLQDEAELTGMVAATDLNVGDVISSGVIRRSTNPTATNNRINANDIDILAGTTTSTIRVVDSNIIVSYPVTPRIPPSRTPQVAVPPPGISSPSPDGQQGESSPATYADGPAPNISGPIPNADRSGPTPVLPDTTRIASDIEGTGEAPPRDSERQPGASQLTELESEGIRPRVPQTIPQTVRPMQALTQEQQGLAKDLPMATDEEVVAGEADRLSPSTLPPFPAPPGMKFLTFEGAGFVFRVTVDAAAKDPQVKLNDAVEVIAVKRTSNGGVDAGDRLTELNGKTLMLLSELRVAIENQNANLRFASGAITLRPLTRGRVGIAPNEAPEIHQ